ncbi:MAG: M23 family metallopeptidase [Deltaproteobacteria bacterium]|nr:M23 family metallopeptidase [Deltaproteobacteria bacterium]
MRWHTKLIITLITIFFSNICMAESPIPSHIRLSSQRIFQGGVGLIAILTEKGEHPRVTWLNKTVHLVPNDRKTKWQGFLAADLQQQPGRQGVTVTLNPSGHQSRFDMEIIAKDYGVQRLTLPPHTVDLDEETLKRVLEEQKIMSALWKEPEPAPLWHGAFLRPVPGIVVGPFGKGRIINEQPRSPHTGVDLRGEAGTPVKAMNRGKIVLTDEHFFSGRSVVIDHGGEILSMYFHLEKILVRSGETVEKGQVIGLVGSSGRASGPHLHWGIRLNGVRIDPIELLDISRQLEE